jgi:hypothetical protein
MPSLINSRSEIATANRAALEMLAKLGHWSRTLPAICKK